MIKKRGGFMEKVIITKVEIDKTKSYIQEIGEKYIQKGNCTIFIFLLL